MKTATVRINHMFGTKNGFASDISYRDKVLKTFIQDGTTGLAEQSQKWAINQGFSHVKIIFG